MHIVHATWSHTPQTTLVAKVYAIAETSLSVLSEKEALKKYGSFCCNHEPVVLPKGKKRKKEFSTIFCILLGGYLILSFFGLNNNQY